MVTSYECNYTRDCRHCYGTTLSSRPANMGGKKHPAKFISSLKILDQTVNPDESQVSRQR